MVTYGQIIMILSGVLTIGAVITMFSKIVKWFDRFEDRGKKNTEDVQTLHNELMSRMEAEGEKRSDNVKKLEDEIRSVKDESVILVQGTSACLDGIHQLGANHSVSDAKQKLDEYMNIAAHR